MKSKHTGLRHYDDLLAEIASDVFAPRPRGKVTNTTIVEPRPMPVRTYSVLDWEDELGVDDHNARREKAVARYRTPRS